MKHIKSLTSLRALAAFLVFMYHYAWLFSPDRRGIPFSGELVPLMPIWKNGQIGVSIFFVLSGFLITRIYFDKFANNTASLRLFFVKRIARIWPLFLVFTTIQHIGLYFQGESISKSWLITLSMTQGFFEHQRNAGLPTAWSLTIEESFYIAAPLIFIVLLKTHSALQETSLSIGKTVRLTSSVIGIAIVLAITGEMLIKLLNNFGMTWEGLMLRRPHVLHSTLFGRFPEFGIGIVAAFIHRGIDVAKLLKGKRADVLLLGCFAAIGVCMCAESGPLSFPILPGLITGVLILALTAEQGIISKIMSHSLLEYLGKVSYGFYLIQLSVIIEPMVVLTDKLGYFRIPVLLILTNTVCAIVYQIVEVPARRYIVGKWGKSR